MDITFIIKQLNEKIKSIFANDSSGHDMHHLTRTLNLALHIQETEGGDRDVIAIAAFLHDVHRIIQVESGKYCPPADSIPLINQILKDINIPDDKKEKIIHCITYHEEYGFSESGKTVDDIETLVLQDADNLDAMGAIGIARTFAFSGAHKVVMWQPEIPLERKYYSEDLSDPSTIHHFYSKLLKLKENMNTETGRQMALERHQFMEEYLRRFFLEWDGKK